MRQLPTADQMFGNAYEALGRARNTLFDARDWVKSDHRPLGSPLTTAQVEAVSEVLRVVGEAKALIDQAKDAIEKARGWA
jgi:uncharacterized protein YjbJ (UPF0337 family)